MQQPLGRCQRRAVPHPTPTQAASARPATTPIPTGAHTGARPAPPAAARPSLGAASALALTPEGSSLLSPGLADKYACPSSGAPSAPSIAGDLPSAGPPPSLASGAHGEPLGAVARGARAHTAPRGWAAHGEAASPGSPAPQTLAPPRPPCSRRRAPRALAAGGGAPRGVPRPAPWLWAWQEREPEHTHIWEDAPQRQPARVDRHKPARRAAVVGRRRRRGRWREPAHAAR